MKNGTISIGKVFWGNFEPFFYNRILLWGPKKALIIKVVYTMPFEALYTHMYSTYLRTVTFSKIDCKYDDLMIIGTTLTTSIGKVKIDSA